LRLLLLYVSVAREKIHEDVGEPSRSAGNTSTYSVVIVGGSVMRGLYKDFNTQNCMRSLVV